MKLTKKKLVEMIETIVESLITEDSVQQVRRNFVDTGKISEKDFKEILKTSNKSNNITWLASRVGGTNKIRKIINPEDIYKFKQYFDVFERNKKQYNPSDINKYQTKSEVED
jgi:hypothetical protein